MENSWIDCKKELPSKLESVLVYIPEQDNHITSGMLDLDNVWVLLYEYKEAKSEITHWMYLPELP